MKLQCLYEIIGTDGGKNPTFQEKFQIPLIEGLREFNVAVWNSNTVKNDDFIGSGRYILIGKCIQPTPNCPP